MNTTMSGNEALESGTARLTSDSGQSATILYPPVNVSSESSTSARTGALIINDGILTPGIPNNPSAYTSGYATGNLIITSGRSSTMPSNRSEYTSGYVPIVEPRSQRGLISKSLLNESKIVLNDQTFDPCSICIEQNLSMPLRVLSCSHHFHINCIDEWFTENTHCPMCRKDFTPETQRKSSGNVGENAFIEYMLP